MPLSDVRRKILEELKNNIKLLYIAYCLKRDEQGKTFTSPRTAQIMDGNILPEIVRSKIADNLYFIISRRSGESKTISIEDLIVDPNTIIEIDHPDKEFKKIPVREVFTKLIEYSDNKEKFLEYSNIIAMKYLKITYSRTSALVIASFTYEDKTFIAIISGNIGPLDIPIYNENQGLSIEHIENAILGALSGNRWRANKIALYPAFDREKIFEDKVKLYNKGGSEYWPRVFEPRRILPEIKRKKILLEIINIAYTHGHVIREKLSNKMKEIMEREEVPLDVLADTLNIKETKEYQKIREQIRGYVPVIYPKDFEAEIRICGKDFILRTTLKTLLMPEPNIEFFEHQGSIGILIKNVDRRTPVEFLGLKVRKVVPLETLIGEFKPLREIVREL